MATTGTHFQPIPMINMDEDIDGEQPEEEEKHKPVNVHLAKLDAMAEEYNKLLNSADIETPMESKNNDSILLYELLDKDQQVPPKLMYDPDENGMDDPDENGMDWEYHPRLGDLEKREIILTIKSNKKNGKKRKVKKEILWFAKDSIDSKRKVFISIKIKRISAIDNIKETFRMRFHMYLNWIMTENEYRNYKQSIGGKYYYEPLWKPDLEFMNSVETHKKEIFQYPEFGKYKVEIFKDFWVDKALEKCHESQFDPQLCYFIRTKLECDITFAEELELQAFPFDCQDLSCIIKGNFLNKQQYIFLPELRAPNFASIDPRYSVLDEWDLTTALIEFADDSSGRTKKRTYPTIVIRLKVQRKWRAYVINIVLLLCALCGLSLCAFYLHHDQIGERFSLLITLILTCVAFSIVIQDKLPNVAYLTFIDKYILGSYFFLILVMIESVFVSTIDDEEYREATDIFLFYVASVLWFVLMCLVFIVYGYKLRQKEKLKIFYSSDQIDEIVNKSLPRLVFDYKNSQRTGHKRRILSFMADIKTDENTSQKDRDRSDNLFRKYNQSVTMQRKLSMHQKQTKHQQGKPNTSQHVPNNS